MADTTVDSLQIEIEASSEKAVEKLNALTNALKSLQAATKGKFGDIQRQIQGLGETAGETTAVNKTRKRKQVLDRAVEPARQAGHSGVDADKISGQIDTLNGKIDTAKVKIAELKQNIKLLGFAHDKVKGASAIEEQNRQLGEQQAILDGLIQKRERLSKLLLSGEAKSTKQEKTADPWAELKENMKGSTLGEIVGDTATIDEAVSRMVELGDQASILQVKMEGLREKLTGAFEKGNQTQIANYTSQIQKLQSQIAELKDTTSQAVEPETEMVESETSLQKKLSILQKIRETIEGISANGSIGKSLGSVEGLKGILGKDLSLQSLIPKGAASGVSALGGAFGGLRDKMLGVAAAHPILAAALVGVTIAAKTVGKGMKSLAQSAASAAKKGFELLAAGAKKLTSALINLVASGIGKAVSGLKSLGKSIIKNVTGPFTKSAEKISKWKQMLGNALFYSTVFRAMSLLSDGIKTGMDNLYQYSKMVGTQFAPAMNQLATSALYLKNSIGAMAAPLIQALAPAIDFLIDKFVALINVIGKAFAVLTGKSVYIQAKKHAVEYGEAANKASKATKDFLLGIDELNVLNDSAGGGGGAATDFGSMFEEVEVPTDQFDWVKQIREAIENGEWRSVGELVAEKLNEVVDSWDSYAWGAKLGGLLNNGLNVAYGFLTGFDFSALGGKIADGLNGIFDEVDFDLLGRTFAAKWTALFDFIYGFATTLKWHEIGLNIAEAINGFLDELDAVQAAAAVSKFVVGIFDTISTAIAETKWDVLGTKLADFINKVDWYGAIYGALSVITNGLAALKAGIDGFLRSWNWQVTARQTYSAVNRAFSDVDWSGLGNTLGNAFVTAFNFLRETIEGIEWESIGSDVAAFLNGIDWPGLLSGLATTIASALNAVVGTLSALVRDLDWEEVGRSVGNAINDFFAKFDWVSFFTGLAQLATGVMNGISAALETVDWNAAWKAVKEGLDAIDWGALVESAGRLIVDAFVTKLKLEIIKGKAFFSIGADIMGGLFEGILDAVAGIGEWLKTNLVDPIVNGVKSLFGIHSPSTVFAEIGGNLIAGLLEGVSAAWGAIVDFFGGGLETLKTYFAQGWENIQQTASTAWEAIQTNLGTTWDNIKTSAGEKFAAIKDGISTAWENTKTATGEKWESIKSNLASTWENLKTTAGITFETIKATVMEKWESVKSDTTEKWDRVKATLSDAWDSMKSTATSKLAEIKVSISETWGNIVSSAVSWGKDLCSNLASGIQSGISKVTSAVSSVADRVRDFLHFSEPDVGPLSDFHTYMPDMLDLMAKGIKDNTYLAVSAANDLAGKMSEALGNIEPVEPRFSSIPTPQYSAVSANAQANSGSLPSYTANDSGGGDNSDVIAVLNAGFQALIEAVNNQEHGVYLDGKQLMQSVERSQRQRGANIMGGGVLG